MRITFLIPAYNEAATIDELLERVHTLDLDKQVVVVDDGSTDATPQILQAWERRRGVVVVRQPNRGKGAAIRAAIPLIDGDIAVIQDADLEYDPADVPSLVEPITRGVADVVYGSRLSGGRPQRAYMFWHLVGNRFLSLMTNVLFNTTLTDMETGYKAFRADVLRSLSLREDDFGIEPEITGQVCKRKLRIYELPIAYYGRTYAEGKKISWRDGAKALRVLIRVRVGVTAGGSDEIASQAPLRTVTASGAILPSFARRNGTASSAAASANGVPRRSPEKNPVAEGDGLVREA
jgi:glycosyltransferase involved in cell wall biosynthesis